MEYWPDINMTKEGFQNHLDSLGFDFWSNLPKYMWADSLVKLCESFGDVSILTAPTKNPECSSGKFAWINKHYPHLSKKMIINRDKFYCAAPDRILIDDTEKKVNKFAEYGGKHILFPQEWNSNHTMATYPGRMVYTEILLKAHAITIKHEKR